MWQSLQYVVGNGAYADTQAYFSAIEIAGIGLDVADLRLDAGDMDGAIYAPNFASKQFALDLERIKTVNPDMATSMHLALLDLPPAIKGQSSNVSADMVAAINMLDGFDTAAPDPRLVVLYILIAAD